MLDRAGFVEHLRRRAKPYVSLIAACAGAGDALTVDDSTVAAAAACRIARDLGHEVTFFINPLNISEQRVYFFAELDAALDQQGVLPSRDAQRALRKEVKRAYLAHGQIAEIERIVAATIQRLHVATAAVPRSLQTITVDDVLDLADRGVSIGNHGWSHVEIRNLTDEEFLDHVRRGSEWISDTIHSKPLAYAIPFGETPLSADRERVIATPWFLADDELTDGRSGTNGWNRRTLVLGSDA